METPQTKGKLLLFALLAVLLVLVMLYVLQQRGFKPNNPADYLDKKLEDRITQTQETKTGENIGQKPATPGVEFEVYPEDFPKDLMVYPGAFEQSLRYKNPQGQEIISFTHGGWGDAKESLGVYKQVLSQNKWGMDERPAGEGVLLTVYKDKMRAEITFMPVDSKTSKVQVVYYLPK